MATIQTIEGKMIVCRRTTKHSKQLRAWHFVKHPQKNRKKPSITLRAIYLPPELIGKKVRIIIEEIT